MHAGIRIGASLALAGFAAGALAEGSGYFRMAENRQEYSHGYAVARDDWSDPPKREVKVYLTSHPVSLDDARAAIDLDDLVSAQLGEVGGSMVRIDLPPDEEGYGPSMWFMSHEPSDTFNTSGSGEFTLGTRSESRVAGRWVLAEPSEFFDKTYQFELEFDAEVVDANPQGEALPEGGGAVGKAWLQEVAAVAGGDADYFRKRAGEAAEYLLPKDDPEAVASFFESYRWSTPKSAKVHGGLLMGDRAILRISGVDYDDDKLSGAVFLEQGDHGWEVSGTDFTTHW